MLDKRLFLIVSVFLVAARAWPGDVPDTINLQGRLTDQNGVNKPDGAYNITFSVWDDEAAGSEIWQEQRNVVTRGGGFQLALGAITPLPTAVTAAPSRYLQIKVDNDVPLVPRQKLQSSPFALKAGKTAKIEANAISEGDLAIQGKLSVVNGVAINGVNVIDATGKWVGDSTGLRGEKGDRGDQGIPGLPGASPFTLNGNNAVYTQGNVGIGTLQPTATLDVLGYVRGSQGLCIGGDCKTAWPQASSLSWGSILGVPAGFSDGIDNEGIASESDPSVPASLKDGVSWNEIGARPAGLDDGDQVGLTAEADTLDSVAARGAITTRSLNIGGLTASGQVQAGSFTGDGSGITGISADVAKSLLNAGNATVESQSGNVILKGTRIGINTTTPANTLSVGSGDVDIAGDLVIGAQDPLVNARLSIVNPTTPSIRLKRTSAMNIGDDDGFIQTFGSMDGTNFKFAGFGLSRYLSSDMYAYMASDSPGGLVFSVDGGNHAQMVMRANGNVGIGTSEPAHILDIKIDATSGRYVRIKNGNTHGHAMLYIDASSSNLGEAGIRFFRDGNDKWDLGSKAGSGDAFVLSEGPTDVPRLVVKPGGNVGIGTSSPQSKLDVLGNAVIWGDLSVAGKMNFPSAVVVASITVNNLYTTSANFTGEVRAEAGIKAGTGTVIIAPPGDSNAIIFDESTGGVIKSTQPGASLRLLAGGSIVLESSEPVRFESGGQFSSLNTRDGTLFNSGNFNVLSGLSLSLNTSGSAHIFMASGPLNKIVNVGIGNFDDRGGIVPSKLSVRGGTSIGANYGGLFVAPSNGMLVEGSVGIGTDNPQVKLDVVGEIRAQRFIGDGSGLTGISAGPADSVFNSGNALIESQSGNVLLRTNASDRMVINAAGNVGVGTTNPTARLQVNAPASITGGAATAVTGIHLPNVTVSATGQTGPVVRTLMGRDALTAVSPTAITDAMNLYVDGAPSAGSNVTIANRYALYVDGIGVNSYFAGNVGIGISSPQSKLDVAGEVKAQKFTGDGSGLTDIFAVEAQSVFNLDDVVIGSQNGKIRLYAGAAQRMVVDSSGNMGIGTSVPQAMLHIVGQDAGGYGLLSLENPTGTLARLTFRHSGDLRGSAYILGSEFHLGGDAGVDTILRSGNLEKLRILATNGNVGIGTAVPNTKFHVFNGDIALTPGYKLDFSNGSGSKKIGYSSPSLDIVNGVASEYINFQIGTANRMTVGAASVMVNPDLIVGGNVGIGTNNPQSKLQVNGITSLVAGSVAPVAPPAVSVLHLFNANVPALGTGNQLLIGSTGGTGLLAQIGMGWTNAPNINYAPGVIGFTATDSQNFVKGDLIFATRDNTNDVAPTERLRITSNGNVGIGTGNPVEKMMISGGGVVIGGSLGAERTGAMIDYQQSNNTARYMAGHVTGPTRMEFLTNAGGTSLLTAMTIDSNQRVGIGTSFPLSDLDINGDIRLRGNSFIMDNAHPDSRLAFYDASNLFLAFRPGGNVGIGTVNPVQKLDVGGYVRSSSGFCIGSDCRASWPTVTEVDTLETVISRGNVTSQSITVGGLVNSGNASFGGRVGIGTISAKSSFQVVGDYIQIPVVAGNPLSSDCDTSDEAGRMVVSGAWKLCVCRPVGNGVTWDVTYSHGGGAYCGANFFGP
ncbi:MAG: hypothetical protein AABZ44_08710 [Elusimicrobiota bacterium]